MLFEWVVNSNNLEAKAVVFTWEPGNISYSTCASESQALLHARQISWKGLLGSEQGHGIHWFCPTLLQ